MQIFLTSKSTFSFKLSYKINLHFKTASYIFQQHIPYSYIDKLHQQFFTANFFTARHTHFSTSIKCIQYTLLLIENYSQVIFYNLRQSSTKSDMHIVYMAIFPRKMSKLVWTCQSTLRFVEACKSYFFPSLSLYPYIWKLFKESFDKFMQNQHNYYSTLHLKCQVKS